MRDVDALNDEMQAAGAWVFAGGLHAPSTATVVRVAGRRGADDRRPVRRGQGAPRRLHDRRGAPTSTTALEWGAQARAGRPRLPIEVRPFQVDGLSAGAEIERVFREEYGRAVAVLVRVFGDIDVAEEAVQDAFAVAVAALAGDRRSRRARPGWIITTARNRAIDRLRREASRDDRHAQAALLHARDEPAEEGAVRDDRLRLIFTCCHPALARARAGRAHAAPARRPHDRRDRARVPRPRADDGAAARPRQRRRSATRGIPYRVPGEADLPGPPARRARRRLPDLQRGLHGQLGRAPRPRRPVRRGDPARTAARRADARRAGGRSACSR